MKPGGLRVIARRPYPTLLGHAGQVIEWRNRPGADWLLSGVECAESDIASVGRLGRFRFVSIVRIHLPYGGKLDNFRNL